MNINFIKKFFKKIKTWYLSLPDRKRHIELLTATLSIPMMITVILVNFYSIKNKQINTTPTPTSAPIQVIVENPISTSSSETSNPPKTTTPTSTIAPTKIECKKDIGVIEILSPQEGEIITSDNVCITISTDSKYCPVTWSYKLDDSNWSDFNNNDICLYNLTTGKKDLQIKIKSSVIDKTITLERTFTYQSSNTPTTTPTPSPTATPNTE